MRSHSTSWEMSRATPENKSLYVEIFQMSQVWFPAPTHTSSQLLVALVHGYHCLLGSVDSCTHRADMCTDIKVIFKIKTKRVTLCGVQIISSHRFSKRSVFMSRGSLPPDSCCGWGVGLGFILVVFEARCHCVALAILELLFSRLASNSQRSICLHHQI